MDFVWPKNILIWRLRTTKIKHLEYYIERPLPQDLCGSDFHSFLSKTQFYKCGVGHFISDTLYILLLLHINLKFHKIIVRSIFRCIFDNNEKCLEWYDRILKITNPPKQLEQLFAFYHCIWSIEKVSEILPKVDNQNDGFDKLLFENEVSNNK